MLGCLSDWKPLAREEASSKPRRTKERGDYPEHLCLHAFTVRLRQGTPRCFHPWSVVASSLIQRRSAEEQFIEFQPLPDEQLVRYIPTSMMSHRRLTNLLDVLSEGESRCVVDSDPEGQTWGVGQTWLKARSMWTNSHLLVQGVQYVIRESPVLAEFKL